LLPKIFDFVKNDWSCWLKSDTFGTITDSKGNHVLATQDHGVIVFNIPCHNTNFKDWTGRMYHRIILSKFPLDPYSPINYDEQKNYKANIMILEQFLHNCFLTNRKNGMELFSKITHHSYGELIIFSSTINNPIHIGLESWVETFEKKNLFVLQITTNQLVYSLLFQ